MQWEVRKKQITVNTVGYFAGGSTHLFRAACFQCLISLFLIFSKWFSRKRIYRALLMYDFGKPENAMGSGTRPKYKLQISHTRKIVALKTACNKWIWYLVERSDSNNTKFSYMHFLKTFSRAKRKSKKYLLFKFIHDIEDRTANSQINTYNVTVNFTLLDQRRRRCGSGTGWCIQKKNTSAKALISYS